MEILSIKDPTETASSIKGRKAVISRQCIIDAATKSAGPQKSVSALSLREVARRAGISPNSFYRHFTDINQLAVAVIEQSGLLLRQIVAESRASRQRDAVQPQPKGVIRTTVDIFVDLLNSQDQSLRILMREARLGSSEFQQAAQSQLDYFECQLEQDIIAFRKHHGLSTYKADVLAKAATCLTFAMGEKMVNDQHGLQSQAQKDCLISMLQMLFVGGEAMGQQLIVNAELTP